MKEIKTGNLFIKDFSWYFLGSFLPMLIGFIKTPIFTRHFSKEDYGYLGLISITFTFFGMFLFSWIGSCIWRFYNKYKAENTLKILYSNLFFLYTLAFILLLGVSMIWYMSVHQILVKKLILYSFFQLFLNQLFLFYVVVIRLKGQAKLYTVIQTIKALISIVIALIMVFYFKANIVALVSSIVIVDAFTLVFLVVYNPVDIKINVKYVRKINLMELLTYGSIGLILNISLLVISYSDRYIIAWFGNLEDVGVYDQVYKIAQLSVMALVTVFFNTINPHLLKELETNYAKSNILIQKYIKAFVIFGLPIIFYLSLFSKDISTILLGEEFRVGYTIMPYVFFSIYLYGISNFYELRLKFSNKFKKLGIIALTVAILNIILNIVFIPLYGYKWAAYTTFMTYLVLTFFLHYLDKEVVLFTKRNSKVLLKIIFFLGLQGLVYRGITHQFNLNILIKLSIGFLYALIYLVFFKKLLLKTRIPVK